MAPGGGWLRTGSGPAAVVEGRSQSLLPCRQWPAPQKAPWPARACGRDWDADGSSLGPVCSPLWDGWARRLIWGPADLPGQGPLCRRGGCPRPREQQGTLCANFWGHHARCGHPRAAPSPTVPGAGSRGQPSLRREAGNGWTRAHTRRTQSAELCSGGEAELGGVLTPHTPFCQLRGNQAPPVAAPPSSLGIAGVPTPSRASLPSCG